MKKIIVVSDSHGNNEALKKVVNINSDASLYLHLGDSEEMENNIYPFITIKGNNDYYIENETRIVSIDNIKIFMTHGHKMYLSKDNMVLTAKKNNCNIFLYGHKHIPFYEYYNGIHILNPGALAYPRSPIGETYAIITLFDNNQINVEIKQLY